jgi:hypothetical protein
MKQVLLVAFLMVLPASASAHGGGLDASGCHTNRKTGDYHCHRGGGSPGNAPATSQRVAPPEPRPAGPTCYTGPRGGRYTITASGRKNYQGC